MPADDHPIDALRHQFEMEDNSVSPVTRIIADLGSTIEFPWPVGKAIEKLKEHLSGDSIERIRLLLDTCAAEICKLDREIERLRQTLSAEAAEARTEAARELLLDGARKAEGTRAKERVRRIGLILAHAIAELQPTDADEVEEMMRVAMELSDHDIGYLRELIRIEGSMLEGRDHLDRYNTHATWESGKWGNRIDPEIDSVFSKLESYGLVARIAPPNNLNIMADFQNRYVLLKKALRFASLIREATAT